MTLLAHCTGGAVLVAFLGALFGCSVGFILGVFVRNRSDSDV